VLPGVADGTRTHDDQNHNLGLYQLSYSHRRVRCNYSQRLQFAAGADAATAASTLTLKRRSSAL
jgi:hypothetical protein